MTHDEVPFHTHMAQLYGARVLANRAIALHLDSRPYTPHTVKLTASSFLRRAAWTMYSVNLLPEDHAEYHRFSDRDYNIASTRSGLARLGANGNDPSIDAQIRSLTADYFAPNSLRRCEGSRFEETVRYEANRSVAMADY